ncbi:olfactory receptor 1G1-like [Rhinophrynus dorsalis]
MGLAVSQIRLDQASALPVNKDIMNPTLLLSLGKTWGSSNTEGYMNITIRLKNQTVLHEFILLGFPDSIKIRYLLFPFFFLMYLMTICGNLLILILIHNDNNLHTPMYFFLGNLACLDTFCSTVTVPRILIDLFSGRNIISLTDCVAQIFFFMLFASSEVFLLAGMSYDRYTAICHPLHYIHIMSWKVCVLLVSVAWTLGFFNGLINSLFTLRLVFCAENTIYGFFCDLPLLLQISCTDIFINILAIFLNALILGLLALGITFIPYVAIFQAILRIPSKVLPIQKST